MKKIGQFEDITRGSHDFPIAFHTISNEHPRYEMNCHWHSDTEIVLIESGTLDMQLDNAQQIFKAGDIIYIPENTLHGAIPHDCVYYCIVFSEKKLFCNAGALFYEAEKYTCCVLHSDRHALRNISAAILERARMAHGDIFRIYSNIFALYGEFAHGEKIETSTSRKSTKRIEILKNAISMIENQYSNEISLKSLADACEMSPEYFCSFFKSITGKTPFEYLNLYRIEAACGLLAQKQYKITEIALMCGFNDLSYFIKTFRKYKGMSPGKYDGKPTQQHAVSDTLP